MGGTSQTRSGPVALSVLHAPPEVFDGKPAGTASDVYSLASTLFTLIYGQPPFYRKGDETLTPLVLRVAAAPLPDLSHRGLPASTRTVFEKAMAKDPKDRHSSAVELARALRAEQERAGLIPTAIPLETEPEPASTSTGPAGLPTEPERRSSTIATPTQAAAPARPVTRRSHVRSRWMRVFGAVAVVMVLAGGLVVALKEQPSSTAAHTGASSPSPSTNAADQPLPAGLNELPPGSYRPTVFNPDIRLRLGPGWRLASGERPDALELANKAFPNTGLDLYLVDAVDAV